MSDQAQQILYTPHFWSINSMNSDHSLLYSFGEIKPMKRMQFFTMVILGDWNPEKKHIVGGQIVWVDVILLMENIVHHLFSMKTYEKMGCSPYQLVTLQETNISHLGKFGKSSTQNAMFLGGYVSSLEGFFAGFLHHQRYHDPLFATWERQTSTFFGVKIPWNPCKTGLGLVTTWAMEVKGPWLGKRM